MVIAPEVAISWFVEGLQGPFYSRKPAMKLFALQCAYQNSLAGSPKGFAWKQVVAPELDDNNHFPCEMAI